MLTVLYLFLVAWGTASHEMWRDEYQAWMIARDAGSPAGVLANLAFDGHPALWHLCLYVLGFVRDTPQIMQGFHVVLAVAFAYLFLKFSPFHPAVRVLFCFSYLFVYEYAVISRSYALSILLVFLFCVLQRRDGPSLPLKAGVLFLLANTNVFGLVLAVVMGCVMFVEAAPVRFSGTGAQALKKPGLSTVAAACIWFAGVAFSLVQIIPAKGGSFPVNYPRAWFDPARIGLVSSRMLGAFVYVPDFRSLSFWNTHLFMDCAGSGLALIGACLLFACLAITLMRRPLVLAVYAAGTLLYLAFFYVTGMVHIRYCGFLPILFITCNWLAENDITPEYDVPILRGAAGVGRRIRDPILIFMLGVGVFGGAWALYADSRCPFSASMDAAEFIVENGLEKRPVVGATDFIVSPLACLLGKSIYYIERSEYGTFVIWDGKRRSGYDYDDLVDAVDTVLSEKGEAHLLVVLSNRLTYLDETSGIRMAVESMRLDDRTVMKQIVEFSSGIVEDEHYFIYAVTRAQPAG